MHNALFISLLVVLTLYAGKTSSEEIQINGCGTYNKNNAIFLIGSVSATSTTQYCVNIAGYNNTLIGVVGGVGFVGPGLALSIASSNNTKIQNVFFSSAVFSSNSNNTIIEQCTFNSTNFATMSGDMMLVANTFNNVTVLVQNTKYIQFMYNTLTGGTGQYVIRLYEPKQFSITDNTFMDSTADKTIFVDSSVIAASSEILRNQILGGTSASAIYVIAGSSSQLTISNNLVSGAVPRCSGLYYGMYLSAGGLPALITFNNNRLENINIDCATGLTGIAIFDGVLQMNNNSISNITAKPSSTASYAAFQIGSTGSITNTYISKFQVGSANPNANPFVTLLSLMGGKEYTVDGVFIHNVSVAITTQCTNCDSNGGRICGINTNGASLNVSNIDMSGFTGSDASEVLGSETGHSARGGDVNGICGGYNTAVFNIENAQFSDFKAGNGGALTDSNSISCAGGSAAYLNCQSMTTCTVLNTPPKQVAFLDGKSCQDIYDIKPPVNVQFYASKNSINITWESPDAGGYEYIANISVDNLVYFDSCKTASFVCTFTSLMPNTTYYIRLYTHQSSKESQYLTSVVTTLPFFTAPGKMNAPTGISTDSTVELQWEPNGDGGSPILQYTLQRQLSNNNWGNAYTGLNTQALVSDLSTSATYLFRVFATNAFGSGEISSIASFTTSFCSNGKCDIGENSTNCPIDCPSQATPDVPEAPRIVAKTETTLTIAWNSPGGTVLYYTLQMFNASAAWFDIYNGSNTVYTAQPLLSGTQYSFRVAATNSVGQGYFSLATSTFTLPSANTTTCNNDRRCDPGENSTNCPADCPIYTAPATPSLILRSRTTTTIIVQWVVDDQGTFPILNFTLQMFFSSWMTVYIGNTDSYSASNLSPNTTYMFRVSAQNIIGGSNFSHANFSTLSPNITIPKTCENNGGCDYYTSCTDNNNGTRTCGLCPFGMIGDGDTGCTKLCGDGTCSSQFGEDCVTCGDCSTPCGLCGDRVCSGNETCASCPADCSCGTKPCPGNPPCFNHGACQDSGSCVCSTGWAGPQCNQASVPIVTVVNNSTSGAIVSTPNNPLSYSVFIGFVCEIDSTGKTVYSVDVAGLNFTVNEFTTSQSSNTKWSLNAMLPNKASLEITVYKFLDESSNITFANKTTSYSKNTLKIGVLITNWPFKQLANSLSLEFATQPTNYDLSNCEKVDSSVDAKANLNWILINIDGVVMYGQFEHEAEIDGKVRPISFALGPNKTVIATAPHFWNSLVLDPNYQVLLDSKPNCKSHNNNSLLLLQIILPIAIVLFIAVAVLGFVFLLPRFRVWFAARKGMQKVTTSDTGATEMSDIQKIESYQVNTAAGHFKLNM